MCLCRLCGWFTRNEAEYALTYGRHDRVLKVCRFCEEDFRLLGFHSNQVIRLARSIYTSLRKTSWVPEIAQGMRHEPKVPNGAGNMLHSVPRATGETCTRVLEAEDC